MNGALATSVVAPLLAAPSLRSEMVSQLVLGEGVEILDAQGDMRHVRTLLDQYEGWVHRGYFRELSLDDVTSWMSDVAWSEGALLESSDGTQLRAPHRARIAIDGERVRLPDGTRASIVTGRIRPHSSVIVDSTAEPPAEWAWREFAGTPYLWGGVTSAGLDCSGLVQTTFLLRGISLPRDCSQQITLGQKVDLAERRAGDLLFFRARDSDSIDHVAILAGHETIVHSTVGAGGVVRESWGEDGSRASALRDRLVAVRRHP